MSEIRGKNVLITGAASGIGRLLAERMLGEGAASAILWDVNASRLEEVATRLRGAGHRVFACRVDVADTAQVAEAAGRVRSEAGRVDILVNNAGVVVGKDFVEHSHRDIDFTMGINACAPMHVSLEFLPGMIAAGSGHVVNIASAAGMTANPRMSAYVASKWAVIGWSESIRIELERGKTGVRVTTVTPYYIDTGMFAGVKSLIPIVRPEDAVERIMRGIRTNRIFVRMPWLIGLLPLTRGLLPPRAFDWAIGRGLRVYRSMDGFRGRPPQDPGPPPRQKDG